MLDRAAVYVFDTATGERLAEAPRLDRTPHGFRPANFSPDGRYLAVTTTCTRMWDLAELNEAAEASPKSKVQSRRKRQKASDADGKADSDTIRPHPSPLPEGEGTRADASDDPKSKIENPKLHLVASVVPLGHGQWMVVSADGHWLGTRGAEKEICYVIKTDKGQETLTPRQFYKRVGWRTIPARSVAVVGRGQLSLVSCPSLRRALID